MKIINYFIRSSLSVFLVFFVTFNSTLHADNHEKFKTSTDCVDSKDPDCKNSKPYLIYLYTKGRDAYDAARISNNFTEAHEIALELLDRNERNGKRLFKMIIIQLASGNHKNMNEARQWIMDAIDRGVDYAPLWLEKFERMLKEKNIETS